VQTNRQTDTQRDKQTDVTECPFHAGGYAGVGNNTAWQGFVHQFHI